MLGVPGGIPQENLNLANLRLHSWPFCDGFQLPCNSISNYTFDTSMHAILKYSYI